MIPASAIIVALYIAINLDSLSVKSDGTEILKFLVKYTRQGLSHYYMPFNATVLCLRMIARFSGDFRPNNVIHGLFFLFSWKWKTQLISINLYYCIMLRLGQLLH